MISAAIALVGFLAVTFLNTANLGAVKSARQSNAATLCLQERVEQLRLADWRKITSATYLQNTLLAQGTKSSSPLGNLSETVTVEAYPDPNASQKLVVRRDSSGRCATLMSGAGLPAERLARVELMVSWTGSDGRQRSRATTTLMANGGISRMNLPAFGAAAGTTWDPPTTTTSSDSSTPTPSDTTTPATPTPTPTPSNNGNGNGRGNVGGKSGKN